MIAPPGWIDWFNEERLHGELGELGDTTPAEMKTAYYRERGQAGAV